MSDFGEDYGEDGRWLEVIHYDYAPRYYGEIYYENDDNNEDGNDDSKEEGDIEGGELPNIDYNHIAYDDWTIKNSLKAEGLHEQYWGPLLARSKEPEIVDGRYGVKWYYTLLYKMQLSTQLHQVFIDNMVGLYCGYLRSIWEGNHIPMMVTYPMIKQITFVGAWFIEAPLLRYKVLTLDEAGYFIHSDGNESSSDEDEDE